MRELCERHGLWGLRSAEKFVPEAIFGLDEGRLERFLAVLYACDGHAYASDRLHQIGYSTISERLALDVQHLLLRLGIVSRIRTLRREVYEGTDTVAREVLITGQDGLATFCSRVRVCGKSCAARARGRRACGASVLGPMSTRSRPPSGARSSTAKGTRSVGRRQRGHGPAAQPQLARRHPRALAPAHRRARAGHRRRGARRRSPRRTCGGTRSRRSSRSANRRPSTSPSPAITTSSPTTSSCTTARWSPTWPRTSR